MLVYVLVAIVTSNGDKKHPNCPNPYIEPAPIDWIETGNDYVWIIAIIVYPIVVPILKIIIMIELITADLLTNGNIKDAPNTPETI